MNWIAEHLWLIPALPLAGAIIGVFCNRARRLIATGAAIGAMGLSWILSFWAFALTLIRPGDEGFRHFTHFNWMNLPSGNVPLGWLLDPLGAAMILMITTVGLLIFIYSAGYMAHDPNAGRFFCFLSLFAAAMLGLVLANSLLLLFICWELVGLASYLLIGFWYQKPAAAAAAKKAFITTRIGDLFLFLGMLWLYAETGTLLFYDNGAGCLEQSALAQLVTRATATGMAVSTGIGLLLFAGAIGKSGQIPLHVWLPDAMEGPTPVSALIHAATMVAAGVFLMARMFPLLSATPPDATAGPAPVLVVTAWVGTLTAVFAACIAVAQRDIKRILAYSTISQLGYMFAGLGMGGVAAGMFHLITHAFFKALLFLGAGSVIHGCHGEQDIYRMGGVRKFMPVTFATFAVGMMALSGVPLFFSGFWSKDEILHAAAHWPVSLFPFLLLVAGAFLTAFYMTRQVCYIFSGDSRLAAANATAPEQESVADGGSAHSHGSGHNQAPHESPRVMTVPLIVLAVFTVGLSLFGTPAWPWFHAYISGEPSHFSLGGLFRADVLGVMLLSSIVALSGIAVAWWIYGVCPPENETEPDPLETWRPGAFALLRDRFRIDELYAASFGQAWRTLAQFCDWMDRRVWRSVVNCLSHALLAFSWASRLFDEFVINPGFDTGCRGVRRGAESTRDAHNGRAQSYLRVIGAALAGLALLLFLGNR